MSTSVLWNLRPSDAGTQLIMFPYLGGFGASFNGLIKRLSGDWDVWTVNPPGHGPSTLSPVSRLAPLVECYVDALRPVLKPGAVFFGHSMGGALAFHVLLAMQGRPAFAGRRPSELVLSACCAPRQLPGRGYAELPEAELLAHLLASGAMPPEVASDKSLVALFLPAFRADYGVLEDVRHARPEVLDIHTRLILGDRDAYTPAGTLQAWQDHLAHPIRTHVLADAEHMFVLHAPEAVDLILNDVRTNPSDRTRPLVCRTGRDPHAIARHRGRPVAAGSAWSSQQDVEK